jgi:hypothetical protein
VAGHHLWGGLATPAYIYIYIFGFFLFFRIFFCFLRKKCDGGILGIIRLNGLNCHNLKLWGFKCHFLNFGGKNENRWILRGVKYNFPLNFLLISHTFFFFFLFTVDFHFFVSRGRACTIICQLFQGSSQVNFYGLGESRVKYNEGIF